jgi:hypothetical protein
MTLDRTTALTTKKALQERGEIITEAVRWIAALLNNHFWAFDLSQALTNAVKILGFQRHSGQRVILMGVEPECDDDSLGLEFSKS